MCKYLVLFGKVRKNLKNLKFFAVLVNLFSVGGVLIA